MNSTRLWVVPANDLEAIVIRDLLLDRGENVLVTAQAWGATWAGLEPGIARAIESFRATAPDAPVYGVELAGPNPFGAQNLDHHLYTGDDRRSPLTSLEQAAGVLGIPLTREQTLVAINDRAWIPGLLEAGATKEEILSIRARDRQAQGVTAADEAKALRDLDSARRENAVWVVPCPNGCTSAHADLLFGRIGHIEAMLLMGPEEWGYSGPKAQELGSLSFPEQHWAGGDSDSGYFGIANPSEETRRRILKTLGIPADRLEAKLRSLLSSP
jgi:hypothetical protein